MKYLISGHEGWLGSRFLNLCEKRGLNCITLNGDLCDENLLKNSFDDDIVIVHFAGCKTNSKDETLRNNVIATSQIVRLSMAISCKHFVYISSIAAVGPSKDVITSSTECKPTSFYGKSKLICEKIVSNYLDSFTIIRPTNIVDENRVGVLAPIYQSMQNHCPYEMWEQSIKSKRDYISLNDMLEATLNIVEKSSKDNEHRKVINLGSGCSYNMEEIVGLLEDRFQAKINKTIIGNNNFSTYDLLVDNSDALMYLKRKPETLKEIISKIDNKLK